MKGSDPAKAHGSLELRIGLMRPMGPMGLMRNRSHRTAMEGTPPISICYLLFAICHHNIVLLPSMLSFTKMNGAGNDFVLLDNRSGRIRLNSDQIGFPCDR